MESNFTRLFSKALQFRIYILWFLAILAFGYFSFFVIGKASVESHGFATYYTASRLLADGEDVAQFYDDDWFSSKVKNYVPDVYEIYHVNPPTTSIMLLPLAFWDYTNARIIWTIINSLIFILTFAYLINKFDFRGKWMPILIIVFFLFQPLLANFAFAQVYVLILGAIIIAWYAFVNKKDFLLGLVLGLIIVLKTAGIILLVLLVIKKRWRSLIWAGVTLGVCILITLPWIGYDSWVSFVHRLSEHSANPNLSVTAYQTVHSFFTHFTSYDQTWNPEPIIDSPFIGKLLSVTLNLTILFLISFLAYRYKNINLTFGMFIIGGILISPASLDYHYVLLLLPLVVFINWLTHNRSKPFAVLLIVFYLLIAVYLPYTSEKVTGGLWVIFAYPKLYGAVGLLGLFVAAIIRSNSSDEFQEVIS